MKLIFILITSLCLNNYVMSQDATFIGVDGEIELYQKEKWKNYGDTIRTVLKYFGSSSLITLENVDGLKKFDIVDKNYVDGRINSFLLVEKNDEKKPYKLDVEESYFVLYYDYVSHLRFYKRAIWKIQ